MQDEYIIQSDDDYLAGKRNPGKGKMILLTEEEARYLVINNEIKKAPNKASSDDAKSSPKAKSS